MRRYIAAHLPVVLLYTLLLVALVVIRNVRQLSWSLMGESLMLFAGVLVGALVLFLDRVVYTYSYPQEQLSQQFVHVWRQRKYLSALSLLDSRRSEQEKLTFRSALFMVIWVPLAFFALTSTTGVFGKGVVMGLMLHILYDAWRLQRMSPERLHTRLFWQVAREVTHEEQLVFLWVMTGIFVLFSLWLG